MSDELMRSQQFAEGARQQSEARQHDSINRIGQAISSVPDRVMQARRMMMMQEDFEMRKQIGAAKVLNERLDASAVQQKMQYYTQELGLRQLLAQTKTAEAQARMMDAQTRKSLAQMEKGSPGRMSFYPGTDGKLVASWWTGSGHKTTPVEPGSDLHKLAMRGTAKDDISTVEKQRRLALQILKSDMASREARAWANRILGGQIEELERPPEVPGQPRRNGGAGGHLDDLGLDGK